jgi:hypothetical protein
MVKEVSGYISVIEEMIADNIASSPVFPAP